MQGKGTRDAFNLLYNCRRLLSKAQSKEMPNWSLACELFAVGHTSAFEICREAGIDPADREVRKMEEYQ